MSALVERIIAARDQLKRRAFQDVQGGDLPRPHTRTEGVMSRKAAFLQ